MLSGGAATGSGGCVWRLRETGDGTAKEGCACFGIHIETTATALDPDLGTCDRGQALNPPAYPLPSSLMHRDSCGRRRCFEWAVGLRMLVRPGTHHQSHSHCAVFCTACRTNILAAALLGCGAAEVHEREPCGRECGVVGCVVRGRYQHREKSGTVVDRTSQESRCHGEMDLPMHGPRPARHRTRASRATSNRSGQLGLDGAASASNRHSAPCCVLLSGWLQHRMGPASTLCEKRVWSGLLVKMNDVARRLKNPRYPDSVGDNSPSRRLFRCCWIGLALMRQLGGFSRPRQK